MVREFLSRQFDLSDLPLETDGVSVVTEPFYVFESGFIFALILVVKAFPLDPGAPEIKLDELAELFVPIYL